MTITHNTHGVTRLKHSKNAPSAHAGFLLFQPLQKGYVPPRALFPKSPNFPPMTMPHIFSSPFRALAVAAFALLAASPIQAQLEVSLSLDKDTYVAHEDTIATVRVLNRAGRDIILNGPSGSWLQLQIKDPAGRTLTPHGGALKAQPMVLRAGQTLTEEVILNHHFSIGRYGRYEVSAAAYFPQQKQFYETGGQRFQITEARKFWSKSVGVPAGYPGAGTIRQFELLTYQDVNRSTVYVRIRDESSGAVLVTFPLGTLIPFKDPQVTVDGGNRLNVLFLTAPDAYRHIIVAPDGSVPSYQDYRGAAESRPSMMIAEDGGIRIRGGAPLLTAAESAAVDSSGDGPSGRSGPGFANPLGEGSTAAPPATGSAGGRTLSERPPGLE